MTFLGCALHSNRQSRDYVTGREDDLIHNKEPHASGHVAGILASMQPIQRLLGTTALTFSLLSCGGPSLEEARQSAIQLAEDLRDPQAIALQIDLQQDSAAVRDRAYQALGRIQDAGSAERLLDGLEDPDPVVRETVFFAIGQLGLARGATANPELVEALTLRTDPEHAESATERLAAIEALGKQAPDDAERRLLPLLADPSAAVRGETVMALLRYRFIPTWRGQREEALPWSDRSVEALSRALADPELIVRQQTAHALSRFGTPQAATALTRALADEDRLVRLWSARALGRTTESTNEEVIEALLQATHDSSNAVRVEATTALGRLGRPDVLPGKLATDPSFHVRRSWAVAVAAGSTELQLDGLRRLLKDPVGEVAAAAVTSLIRRGGQALPLQWMDWIAAEEWQVRVAAAAAAETWETDRLQRLESALVDSDRRVRVAALGALAGLSGILPRVQEALRDEDLAVRATGVALLAEIESTEVVPLLADLLERSPGADWVEVREAAIDALGSRNDSGIAELLTHTASHDEARSVRVRALQGLRARGLEEPASIERQSGSSPSPWLRRSFDKAPRILIETERGSIELSTYPEDAPIHVAHFVELVENGFYDGLIWHRVVSNFVVQGGDPRGDGWGGPGYALRDEISRRRYRQGTVGMPKAGKDTGGCQLFIAHLPTPHLDGNYTIFAQVEKGLDVLEQLRVGDRIVRATRME